MIKMFLQRKWSILRYRQNVRGGGNKRQRIPKGQSKMDNPEKLATQGTQDEEKQNKRQHNMCWTPLYASKPFEKKDEPILLQT